jgi:hypothetical protein
LIKLHPRFVSLGECSVALCARQSLVVERFVFRNDSLLKMQSSFISLGASFVSFCEQASLLIDNDVFRNDRLITLQARFMETSNKIADGLTTLKLMRSVVAVVPVYTKCVNL